MSRRGWTVGVVATVVVVLAVTTAVLVVWWTPEDPVEPGTVRELGAAPYGTERTVLLPLAEVTVVVGAPTRSLGPALVEDEPGEEYVPDEPPLQAARDDRLVPLSWQVTPEPGWGFRTPRPRPSRWCWSWATSGRRWVR